MRVRGGFKKSLFSNLLRKGMRLPFVIIGAAMVAAGIAIFVIYPFSQGHHTIPEGGAGIAVLGLIVAGAGVSMKSKGAAVPSQFKCTTCGRVFDSEQALNSHSRDKHSK